MFISRKPIKPFEPIFVWAMYGHTRRFHQAHHPWIFIPVSCSWALVPIHVTSMETVLVEDVIAVLDFMVMIAVYTNGCLGMMTAYRRSKPCADPDAKKIDAQNDEEVLNKMPRKQCSFLRVVWRSRNMSCCWGHWRAWNSFPPRERGQAGATTWGSSARCHQKMRSLEIGVRYSNGSQWQGHRSSLWGPHPGKVTRSALDLKDLGLPILWSLITATSRNSLAKKRKVFYSCPVIKLFSQTQPSILLSRNMPLMMMSSLRITKNPFWSYLSWDLLMLKRKLDTRWRGW